MTTWTQLISEIEEFTDGIRDLRVSQKVTPKEIRSALEQRYTFDKPIPLEKLTVDISRLLRKWNLHVTHPRYFGLFNPSVRQAGIVADTLVALYNPQLAVWSHAPIANEIEQLTLRLFTKALGLSHKTTLANFTSGGAEANFSAVLTALIQRFPEMADSGLMSLGSRPVIYLTGESHHSFVKIARMTGLGTHALHEIPTDNNFTMNVEALENQIEADRKAGYSPLMVVGTAGTTGAGLVDPLPLIAEVASRTHLWFHVDAAWGGSAVLSPRLRPVLNGIDRADSVTWDAHKWLSVPMGAGMFFCRHPESVKQAFAISTSYMPSETGDNTVDPYAATAQWSRRMMGLKVFMALAEIGLEGYGKLIERQVALGDQLRYRLQEMGWIIRNKTKLPVICFSHQDIQNDIISTGKIIDHIYKRGRVWISDVILGGRERVLRACITSFRSNESDIECLIEELESARQMNGAAI